MSRSRTHVVAPIGALLATLLAVGVFASAPASARDGHQAEPAGAEVDQPRSPTRHLDLAVGSGERPTAHGSGACDGGSCHNGRIVSASPPVDPLFSAATFGGAGLLLLAAALKRRRGAGRN